MQATQANTELSGSGAGRLAAWKNALMGYVRSDAPDLTNRQMALLLEVYLGQGQHTVRGLAQRLGVAKPVVTRALNRLGLLGYLRRERDHEDKRNIYVVRTVKGAQFLEEFGQFLGVGTASIPRQAAA